MPPLLNQLLDSYLRISRGLLLGLAVSCTAPVCAQSQSDNAGILGYAEDAYSLSDAILEEPVPRFKKQAIQRISFAGGLVAATQDGDLNASYFETAIRTGIPLGSFENILGVTPSFRVHWIDSAADLDVPSELYNTGVEFFHLRPISERWKVLAILRPAIRSDFTTSENAFRIFGLGLMIWDWIPDRLSLSVGAVYLDRADLPLLPALGLIWTPRSQSRLELQFPRSRFAHRINKNGAASETWTYLSVGIGGNTWAVTRQSGEPDELSLRDIRLVFGLEKIVAGGGGWFVEAGYAFDRSIEYESDDTEIPISDGIILMGGWAY